MNTGEPARGHRCKAVVGARFCRNVGQSWLTVEGPFSEPARGHRRNAVVGARFLETVVEDDTAR